MIKYDSLGSRFEAAGRDTEGRILEAAAMLFAERGFRAATMRDIATVARINEVTIYRYFPKKRDLCWRAVDAKFRRCGFAEQLIRSLSKDGPPQETLQQLSIVIIEAMQLEPSLGRLLYFTGLELREERRLIYDTYLKPVLRALTIRLNAWIQNETIRPVEPESTALSIISVIFSQLHVEELFGRVIAKPKSVEERAMEYSRFCLSGLIK